LDRPPQVSNLHDFSLWVLRERLGVKRYSGRYVFYISNTIRIPLRKPCLRGFTVSSSSGMARTPPIVGSAFPRGSRRVLLYGVSLLMGSWERRRRTGMAVNHTPILLYMGKDQSLQSIKKKKFNKKKNFSFLLLNFNF